MHVHISRQLSPHRMKRDGTFKISFVGLPKYLDIYTRQVVFETVMEIWVEWSLPVNQVL